MGTGNNPQQIAAFKTQFRANYPIVPDQDRKIAEVLGYPGTPTMIICSRDGKVLAVHGGVIENFDEFLKQVRDLHAKL
jgi:hypothetical protein